MNEVVFTTVEQAIEWVESMYTWALTCPKLTKDTQVFLNIQNVQAKIVHALCDHFQTKGHKQDHHDTYQYVFFLNPDPNINIRVVSNPAVLTIIEHEKNNN